MVGFLQRQGFTLIRVRGSHHFMERAPHRTSVPVHGSRTLKTGTLRSILRDVGISPSEFERFGANGNYSRRGTIACL
jgi:predicted RNA binding protein YcfA (HicA-like mRNA interferase family)